MKERIIEQEILKTLFDGTDFKIITVGSEANGFIPIYKRVYNHSRLHFGTLVDVINNPSKCDENYSSSGIQFLQSKITKCSDISIKDFDWLIISDAIELMANKGHLLDEMEYDLSHDIKDRIISLTYKGAIAYLSNFYLKEYEQSQLKQLDQERLLLDFKRLRNNINDYKETKQRLKNGFIISIITVILSLAAIIISLVKR